MEALSQASSRYALGYRDHSGADAGDAAGYHQDALLGNRTCVDRPISAAPSWNPYQNNGGTVVAVAGDNYAVVAGDTRMSTGFRIHTRNLSKIVRLTDKCVIATSGMQADMVALHRIVSMRIALFEHDHRKVPSINAIAQMLSTILYYRRFFPYYTFNLLAGIDDEGKGAVYGYDAVGSFERTQYVAEGTGSALMMSALDNQLRQSHQSIKRTPPSKEETIDLVKDIITSAAERDIYTGDSADIFVVEPDLITSSSLPLKRD